MNKIKINNNVINIEVNDDIHCIYDNNFINIYITENTTLEVIYELDNAEIFINYYIKEFRNCNLFEIRNGANSKVNINYYVSNNSDLLLNKINHTDYHYEVSKFKLEKHSNVKAVFKIYSNTKNVYFTDIIHEKNSTSKIITNALNDNDGIIFYTINSIVENGIKDCDVLQDTKIITLNNNECMIEPNLYVDDFDVIAEHSAYIGNIDNNKLFYLLSRGINEIDAKNLIIKGFMRSHLENHLINMLDNIER